MLQLPKLRHAKAIGLNPVGQTGHHQIGRQKRILGLLRHRPGQVRRGQSSLGQFVLPGLLQLQVEQATQAQTYPDNENHCSLAQGQALEWITAGVMEVVNRSRQTHHP
ncbi:hypothetical protein D3C71_1514990 [compost metagenome]